MSYLYSAQAVSLDAVPDMYDWSDTSDFPLLYRHCIHFHLMTVQEVMRERSHSVDDRVVRELGSLPRLEALVKDTGQSRAEAEEFIEVMDERMRQLWDMENVHGILLTARDRRRAEVVYRLLRRQYLSITRNLCPALEELRRHYELTVKPLDKWWPRNLFESMQLAEPLVPVTRAFKRSFLEWGVESLEAYLEETAKLQAHPDYPLWNSREDTDEERAIRMKESDELRVALEVELLWLKGMNNPCAA